MEKQGFLRNHGDTIAIIGSTVGVNIALGAILIALHLSNSSGIAACNARIDATMLRIDATMSRIDGMYEVLMNHVKPKPKRSFKPYHEEITQPLVRSER